jgi:hypothetical protein
MIKKILFIQIISLILCSCSSFPLEEKPISKQAESLTPEENKNIKSSKILFNTLNSNWVQERKYQNERMNATFHVNLRNDGTIENLKLTDFFCGDDLNNECENFVLNVKKTILNTFPIKDFPSIDYRSLWLTGGSKDGNELFKKQIKK